MEKERSLSSILRGKTRKRKATNMLAAGGSGSHSKANPSIVLLSAATPRRPRGVRAQPLQEETEEDDQDENIGEDEEGDQGENNGEDDDEEEEENSYDLQDDMSDDGLGLGLKDGEDGHIQISSEEEKEIPIAKKGARRVVRVGQKGVKIALRTQPGSREKSAVWKVFEKVELPSTTESGVMVLIARCRHCLSFYPYKQGGQTTTLTRHVKACKVLNAQLANAKAQTLLSFKPTAAGDTHIPIAVAPGEYNHQIVKELIAKMIIVHEYPFRMVEHRWFNILMQYLNPLYQHIGRRAIRAECLTVYGAGKEFLKKTLKSVKHISLTTDLWTSNQTLSYMCVVAHFIDENWTLQTRVLAFIELDPPHTGHVIAGALFDCVTDWEIVDKIISITLDNAANNDVAVRDLKVMFASRKGPHYVEKYFHVRCCAHIINLVVQDGTECLSGLINNLRETIKYLKKSPARLHKFVGICKSLAIKVGADLKLDCKTRWGSTYRMINTGVPYRSALVSYALSDSNYKWQPSSAEWDLFGKIEPILFALSEVTTAFSGSVYPTANIFYPHIVNVKKALRKALAHRDSNVRDMADAMLTKFDKYWEEKNNVMVIATVLDPRYKMKYVKWCFGQIYGEEKSAAAYAQIERELQKLFQKYDLLRKEEERTSGASITSVVHSIPSSSSEFQSFLSTTSSQSSNSELLRYLEDRNEDLDNKKFKLLEWWKLSEHKYPVMAKMAKLFLTIPATSMSSESTFSTGGRVLDDYRSSLRPYMVEALVCAASMIKGAHTDLNVVENDDEEDVEIIPLPTDPLESN